MSEPSPSYAELAALVAGQAAQLAEQAVLIEALRVELEALRRQVGRDSSNSSQPPSTDGLGAKAKAKAKADKPPAGQESQPSPDGQPSRPGRPRRAQGGQPGHRGSGLAPVATPDRREPVEPSCCGGCGGDLAGTPGTVASRVQVFDLPVFSLAVTEYRMMRRVCGCGQATTADLPAGIRGGPTCYGPNVTAAATLLASQDVLGIERTADLMSALLGVAVSTGFISCCLTRLDGALTTAGFEQALKMALGEQEVLGTDETPAPLTDTAKTDTARTDTARTDTARSGQDCSNPHVYTVRTMRAYTGGGADLVWYGAAGNRTKASISCSTGRTAAARSAGTPCSPPTRHPAHPSTGRTGGWRSPARPSSTTTSCTTDGPDDPAARTVIKPAWYTPPANERFAPDSAGAQHIHPARPSGLLEPCAGKPRPHGS